MSKAFDVKMSGNRTIKGARGFTSSASTEPRDVWRDKDDRTEPRRAHEIFLRNFFALCKRVLALRQPQRTGWGRRPPGA